MKNFIALLLLVPSICFGGVIASMPNQAGGKIVLTDTDCRHNNKSYKGLYKAYNYGNTGNTNDGCWVLEDEAITVIWINPDDTFIKYRYPVQNFQLRKQ